MITCNGTCAIGFLLAHLNASANNNDFFRLALLLLLTSLRCTAGRQLIGKVNTVLYIEYSEYRGSFVLLNSYVLKKTYLALFL